MNSSTRLYERLGQIPQDPEDPESLDDLLVCAFGAFERYYVCWKTKSGVFRQDGYDLPPSLQEWLFPTDGSTRDFASLQVVFGRGDEYFASDKDGKMEMKEPEKPPPEEDRPALRRSRTISFLRPLSDLTTKPISPAIETPGSARRSSSASSQPASRPPSMSFGRPPSDTISSSQLSSRPTSDSSFPSQPTSRPSSITSSTISRRVSDADAKPMEPVIEAPAGEAHSESPLSVARLTRRSRPLSMNFNTIPFPKIVEGRPMDSGCNSPVRPDPAHCTCGCHAAPLPKPTYANASMQTDPITPPPPTTLRIDTDTRSFPAYSNINNNTCSANSSALDIQTPLTEDLPMSNPNPFFMGTMMSYFSKPGYQLGDSLMSSYNHYQPVYDYQEPIYEYQEYQEYQEGYQEGYQEEYREEQWDQKVNGQMV